MSWNFFGLFQENSEEGVAVQDLKGLHLQTETLIVPPAVILVVLLVAMLDHKETLSLETMLKMIWLFQHMGNRAKTLFNLKMKPNIENFTTLYFPTSFLSCFLLPYIV